MIDTTKNYAQFKTSKANRNNREKLKKTGYFTTLKSRIKTMGQLEPILVNEDMFVINGNTRLDACMELGIEVRYKMIKLSKSDSMMLMLESGITTRKWTSLDIVNFHAVSGAEPYKKVERVLEKTGINISYLNLINILANGTAIAIGSEEFNYGRLQDFNEDVLVEYIMIIKPILSNKLISNTRVPINCLAESIRMQGLAKTKETFRVIVGNLMKQRVKIYTGEIPMRLSLASKSKGNKHTFEFSSDTLRR